MSRVRSFPARTATGPVGVYAARAVLKAIEERIRNGEPEQSGNPLAGELAGCRRIHSDAARTVYQVAAGAVEVLIAAARPRRNDEGYRTAGGRD